MRIPARIERPYRVRFDEAGPDGRLRSSGFLRYAQDLAWIHSEGAGFGRDWYASRGLTWLVRAIELDIVDEVTYGSSIDVSTEVVGFRRVWARRRNEFRTGEAHRPIAVAVTDWVLLNAANLPIRPPTEILDAFEPEISDFAPIRLGLLHPPAEAISTKFPVRLSELDPMDHVNNAAYIDYLDELFLNGSGQESLPVPRRYRVEFVLPAEPNADLVGRLWPDDAGWSFRIDAGDRESLRARLETDPAAWVGG